MTITTIHTFEQRGLGKAPFKFVAMFSFPSPSLAGQNPRAYTAACNEAAATAKYHGVHGGFCDACGMTLMNNYIVASSDGHKHVVGCDCVEKTGDKGLIITVRNAEKVRRNAAAKARKTAKLANAKRDARAKARSDRKALFAAHAELARAVWPLRRDNHFLISILRQALAKGSLSENQLQAVRRWLDTNHATLARNAAEAARRATAQYVGKPGERIEATLTVIRRIHGTGFACWTLTLMQDEKGNSFATFGRCPIETGDTKTVKATVKEHKDYKGEKQTSIQRITLAK